MKYALIFFAYLGFIFALHAQPLSKVEIHDKYDSPCNSFSAMILFDGSIQVNCNNNIQYSFDGNSFTKSKTYDKYGNGLFIKIADDVAFLKEYKTSCLHILDSLLCGKFSFRNTRVTSNQVEIMDFPQMLTVDRKTLHIDTIHIPFYSKSDVINKNWDLYHSNWIKDDVYIINSENNDTYLFRNDTLHHVDNYYYRLIYIGNCSDGIRFLTNKGHLTKEPFPLSLKDDPIKTLYLPYGQFEKCNSRYYVVLDNNYCKLYEIDYSLYTTRYIGKWSSDHQGWMDYNHPKVIYTGNSNSLSIVLPDVISYDSEFDELPTIVHALYQVDEQIIVGGYGPGYALIDHGTITKINHSLDAKANKVMPGSIKYQGKVYGLNESNTPVHYFDGTTIKSLNLYINGEQSTSTGYYLDTLRNGTLAMGMEEAGLGIVDSIVNGNFYVSSIGKEKGFELENVLGFDQDSNGNIWMCRPSTGVAVYDISMDTVYNYLRKSAASNIGAYALEFDHHENLWFGGHNGLYYLDASHQQELDKLNFKTHLKNIPLPNQDSSAITLLKQIDDYLIFGNNTAISFIDLKDYYANKDSFPIFQYRFGFEINGKGASQNTILQQNEKYVWIGCNYAVHRFDLDNLIKDQSKANIVASALINGNKLINIIDDKIKIQPSQRDLTLNISVDSNQYLLNNVYYSYTIHKNGSDAIYKSQKMTLTPNVNFEYIDPGNYKINIEAYKNGMLLDRKEIHIKVNPKLSEITWLIPLLLGSILMFFVIGFFLFRLQQAKQKSEKEALKGQLDQAKVQSIISAFNPHFINNSLHWVQSKYADDKDLALVVGRLSANITKLVQSNKNGKAYHTLGEELELVENYVAIQKVRFSDGFDFAVQYLTNDIIRSIPIPIMQLQIHVENAIEHGLRNRQLGTFVKIEIAMDHEYLTLKVTDDGIGREKASKLNSQRTQAGTRMLLDLHAALNKSNRSSISTEYQDLVFGNYGTSVIINIPKDYKYE